MIRFIVAIDQKNGIANDKGIPWNLPADKQFYRDSIKDDAVLMGYNTYVEQETPASNKVNYVATRDGSALRPGFVPVVDTAQFLEQIDTDIWVIGGAKLFESLIGYADELYITKVEADFKCTKFFPDYTKDFELISESERKLDNSIPFRFSVYKKK